MPAYMTVSVSNIHPNATEDDIISHFNSRLEKSNLKVGPLVPYIKKKEVKKGIRRVRRQATTVTFQGEDYNDCEYRREHKLHGSVLKCGEDATTDIAVRKEFLGISPLLQHDEHQFDFLFVHGLGGHPFKSWTSGIESPEDLKMWPRDLLPRSLLEKGYRGRYSTVGYKASGRASASATLNRAAEDLLAVLWDCTQLHDHRPMYFACHGLGGLVLCQALNLLLWKSSNSQVKFQGNNVFMRDGQCNVKGIAFFGTRFEEFANVTQNFKDVRAMHNIEILVYYEGQPVHKRIPSSAGKSLDFAKYGVGDGFEPTRLNADHAGMIQFADEQDNNYEQVSKDICNLIETTLPKNSKATATKQCPSPPISSRPSSPDVGDNGQDNETEIDAQIHSEIRPQGSFDTTKSGREGFLKRFGKGLQQSLQKVKPKSGTTNVPQRDRRISMAAVGDMRESLRPVHGFDKVFILDDSASMKDLSEVAQLGRSMRRWEILVECVQELCTAATQGADDSIDIHFLINQHKDTRNVRSSEQVWEILRGIDIESSEASSLDNVLWRVLNSYLDKHRSYLSRRRATSTSSNTSVKAPEPPKPLNVIVITDGVFEDHEHVEATLIRTARDLPRLKIPELHIGVQFVQIGKVERANRWLKILDDKIRVLYGIRDICDTRAYEYEDDVDAETLHDPVEFQRLLVTKIQEILLGSIDGKYQGFRKDGYWSEEA